LRANAELALRTGMTTDNVVVVDDGVVVDLADGRAVAVGSVPCGYVYVDGSSVGDISEVLLKDRRILRDEGFISVIAVVDTVNGKVMAGPELHARGFSDDDSIFDPVVPKVVEALEASLAEGIDDLHQLQQVIRRVVGKWVADAHRRRPMIVPVVIEV
jgi:ribonuclease J